MLIQEGPIRILTTERGNKERYGVRGLTSPKKFSTACAFFFALLLFALFTRIRAICFTHDVSVYLPLPRIIFVIWPFLWASIVYTFIYFFLLYWTCTTECLKSNKLILALMNESVLFRFGVCVFFLSRLPFSPIDGDLKKRVMNLLRTIANRVLLLFFLTAFVVAVVTSSRKSHKTMLMVWY